MVTPISTVIAPQNFELIRDRIGEILLVNFTKQNVLNPNPDTNPSKVDIERFVTIDESGFPIITVGFIKGKYSNKDYGGNVTGEYCYYVDIYTGSASTGDARGDQTATLNLEKMLGMCRAILDNPIYATLGYDPTVAGAMQIQNVTVEDLFVAVPKYNNNTVDYICGRLQMWVTVPETVALLPTVAVEEIGVTVKLNNTNKGYFWGTPLS